MFKYYGSKYRLASTYQPPTHDTIVEPFAGAAAYSVYWLKRANNINTVLIDLDPLVIALWDRLLSMSPEQIADYPIPAKGDRTDDMFVLCSASAMSTWGAVRNQGSAQVTEWQVNDFPGLRNRVAHDRALIGDRDRVTLAVGDYREAPNIEGCWFIDPPYQSQGEWYPDGPDGLDFSALGAWCKSRSGQVIVTEADPADWLPFEPHRMANNQSRIDGNRETLELVWYSHPEPTLLDLIS